MIHPTKKDWDRWHIHEGSHQFFTLRWFELLDQRTFGTWQIRTANLRSILEELLDSAKTCDRIPAHHANLRAILEEAKVLLSRDEIAKRHKPVMHDYISQLEHLYDTKIRQGNRPDVEEFVRLCRIAVSELSDYSTLAFSEIERLLRSPEFREKGRLHRLAMLLALDLKNMGFAIEYLRSLSAKLISTEIPDFVDRFVSI